MQDDDKQRYSLQSRSQRQLYCSAEAIPATLYFHSLMLLALRVLRISRLNLHVGGFLREYTYS